MLGLWTQAQVCFIYVIHSSIRSASSVLSIHLPGLFHPCYPFNYQVCFITLLLFYWSKKACKGSFQVPIFSISMEQHEILMSAKTKCPENKDFEYSKHTCLYWGSSKKSNHSGVHQKLGVIVPDTESNSALSFTAWRPLWQHRVKRTTLGPSSCLQMMNVQANYTVRKC